MVKLICIDMDGTLLNSQLQVSDENKKAIDLAQKQGIAVTLATGRMYPSALSFARQLGIEMPLITMNGALVKNPVTEEKLSEHSIGRGELTQIINRITHYGYRPNFYDEFNLYVGAGLQRYYQRGAFDQIDPRYQIIPIDESFTYQDLLDKSGDTIKKGIFFPKQEDRELIRRELMAMKNLHVVSSSLTNLEMTNHLADKGKAVLLLGNYLGIRQEEIMVIGDSENDRSMLAVAGHSIVMGNAPLSIKKEASFVTSDNNQDGVARAIRTIALGETC